jgi:serine/threonine protein kinase
VFEYREGVSLEEFINTLIQKNQKISFEDVMALVTKINNALNFIHRNGVIHRDLKPDNIFIDFSRKNLPLVIDFDISCRKGIDCEMAEFIGTEKYATNGAKKIKRTGNKLTFNSYRYSENSDRYALVKIIEEDLIKIIKPEDIMKLKHQIELLQPLKLLGGNRMKRNRMKKNKTRKIIGGEYKIGVLFPRFGGKRKTNRGGACSCQAVPKLPIAMGGYRPTKRNLEYLKMWKKGKSIGFTMRSSLKAKGLIPRANGKKRVSAKYR